MRYKYQHNSLFQKYFEKNNKKEDKEINEKKWSRIIKTKYGYRCANEKKLPHLDHQLFELNSHHLLPKKLGGKNTIKNGIVYCRACHAAQHPELYSYFKKTIQLLRDLISRFIKPAQKFFRYHRALEFLTGSSKFYGNQLKAIKAIVEEGKNIFYVAPTGSGKSMVFQIPAIIDFEKPSLVFEPLRALQIDQVKNLLYRWIPATYLNSDLDDRDYKERINELIKKNIFLCYIHPKQLINFREDTQEAELKLSKTLFNLDFKYIVIDEVHVVERYGLTFVKEYLFLKNILKYFNYPQVILLTATASKKTRSIIKKILDIDEENTVEFVSGYYRKELYLEKYTVYSEEERDELLIRLLYDKPEGKTLIFATTINQVDYIFNFLKSKSFNVCKYHSRLDIKEREFFDKKFKGVLGDEQSSNIMVSTSAYGMGIDIKNIHQVIHYSLPFSITDYYQQIGRAGRDGKKSVAQLIDYVSERTSIIDFINDKTLENEKNENIKNILSNLFYEEKIALLDYLNLETNEQRWNFIINYFGEKLNFKENIILKIKNFFVEFIKILIYLIIFLIIIFLLLS